MQLPEAIARVHEIETGTEEARTAIVAAIVDASPEEVGAAVLLVARDLILRREAVVRAEAEAIIATRSAMRGRGSAP